jgi:hypothetical protein
MKRHLSHDHHTFTSSVESQPQRLFSWAYAFSVGYFGTAVEEIPILAFGVDGWGVGGKSGMFESAISPALWVALSRPKCIRMYVGQ